MAQYLDMDQQAGMFKKVYADRMEDLVPKEVLLREKVPFVQQNKRPGLLYSQPVVVSQEGGITYLGASGDVGALTTPIAHAIQEAQVQGSEMNLRSQVSYKALSSASTAGERAFEKQTIHLIKSMNASIHKRLEIARLYGQSGIGTVSSFSGSTIVIQDAKWAPGIWAGLVGQKVDIYQSDLSTPRTNAVDLTISAVNINTRSVTFSSISGTPVSGDVVFFDGANASGTFSEMAGLQKILTNNGTLFNISASTYDVWAGNTDATAAAISFDRLQDNVMQCMSRGLVGKHYVLVSPKAFGSLVSDQAALRMYDSSYSKDKAVNGSRGLSFHSAAGEMEILPHMFVKNGDYFVLPADALMRIGSTDVTFNMPGTDDPFMVLVAGYNAVEFQAMCDEAIFLEAPCQGLFGSNVTF